MDAGPQQVSLERWERTLSLVVNRQSRSASAPPRTAARTEARPRSVAGQSRVLALLARHDRNNGDDEQGAPR